MTGEAAGPKKEDVLALLDRAREHWDKRTLHPPTAEQLALTRRLLGLPSTPADDDAPRSLGGDDEAASPHDVVTQPEGSSPLLTADEAATMLRVPSTWLYAAARDGRFPCVRMGRHVRFRRLDVHKWIATGGSSATD